MTVITGTSENDYLVALPQGSRLEGLGGNDSLIGKAGVDTLVGGTGDDSLYGDAGNDIFLIGAGDGVDQFYGGPGRDVILATENNISIGIGQLKDIEEISANGYTGVTLTIASYANTIDLRTVSLVGISTIYTSGEAELIGTTFSDRIFGGAGNDLLYGGGGDDEVHGGEGSDRISAGTGRYFGGDGDDRFFSVSMDRDVSSLTGGAGSDEYALSQSNAPLPGSDFLALSGVADTVTDFKAGSGGDRIAIPMMQYNDFLIGWNRTSNPFESGYFRLKQIGSNTVFQIDRTGSGNQYVDALFMQNTWASDFTIANFSDGFSPNGLGQTYTGTNAADTLTGSAYDDTLKALAGNDTVFAGSGKDLIDGAGGNDALYGEGGNDTIIGGVGNDILSGGQDDDILRGGTGNDTLFAGSGNNIIAGDAGNDLLYIIGGENYVDGGDGIDTLSYADTGYAVRVNLITGNTSDSNGQSNDSILNIENVEGSYYNDILIGNAGNNSLSGWIGDDRLTGGAGNDILNGGDGTDTVDYSAADTGLTINLASFSSQNLGTQGYDKLLFIENLVGTAFNDTIEGSSSDNVLDGGAGIDTLSFARNGGSATISLAISGPQNTFSNGNDTYLNFENVTGSSADDRIEGNSGDNLLNGGLGTDTVSYENASSGVRVSLAIAVAQNTVGAGVDTIKSFESINASAFNDILTGSSANNQLWGNAGSDRLTGGLGADNLNGGASADYFIYLTARDSLSTGRDVITDFSSSDQDKIDLSAIDASSLKSGNQDFILGGTSFTNKAGELIQRPDIFANITVGYYIEGDINGDGLADFSISVSSYIPLTATDFIL